MPAEAPSTVKLPDIRAGLVHDEYARKVGVGDLRAVRRPSRIVMVSCTDTAQAAAERIDREEVEIRVRVGSHREKFRSVGRPGPRRGDGEAGVIGEGSQLDGVAGAACRCDEKLPNRATHKCGKRDLGTVWSPLWITDGAEDKLRTIHQRRHVCPVRIHGKDVIAGPGTI